MSRSGVWAERLREECEKRGLPVDFDVLMRHLENNHAAALGAQQYSIETLRNRALALYDALDGYFNYMGDQHGHDTGEEYTGAVLRALVEGQRWRELERTRSERNAGGSTPAPGSVGADPEHTPRGRSTP